MQTQPCYRTWFVVPALILTSFALDASTAQAKNPFGDRPPRIHVDRPTPLAPNREGADAVPGMVVATGDFVPGQGCVMPSMTITADDATTARGVSLRVDPDCSVVVLPPSGNPLLARIDAETRIWTNARRVQADGTIVPPGDAAVGGGAGISTTCRRYNRVRSTIEDVVGLPMVRVHAAIRSADDGVQLSQAFGGQNYMYAIADGIIETLTGWVGFNLQTPTTITPFRNTTTTDAQFVNVSPALCFIGTPVQSPPCYAHRQVAISDNLPDGRTVYTCAAMNGNPGLPNNLAFLWRCNFRWENTGDCTFDYLTGIP